MCQFVPCASHLWSAIAIGDWHMTTSHALDSFNHVILTTCVNSFAVILAQYIPLGRLSAVKSA
ncbi:MAG: hypothetical protein IH819_08775, partial [Bacteroidetes bacterium]|nr:hypothetical protein [Bacteroidota bacterium]